MEQLLGQDNNNKVKAQLITYSPMFSPIKPGFEYLGLSIYFYSP